MIFLSFAFSANVPLKSLKFGRIGKLELCKTVAELSIIDATSSLPAEDQEIDSRAKALLSVELDDIYPID